MIDVHTSSKDLLSKLAISLHERDPKNSNPTCFTMSEIKLVENWLSDFMEILCAHNKKPA